MGLYRLSDRNLKTVIFLESWKSGRSREGQAANLPIAAAGLVVAFQSLCL
jgi:hypothetical protein